MLLATDNTALLRLHEIFLRQAAACVLGRAVVHLRLCADRGDLGTATHVVILSGPRVIRVHLYTVYLDFLTRRDLARRAFLPGRLFLRDPPSC